MESHKQYSKQDAQMTHGLAILSMVLLHLFCREAADFPGKPLIWLNSTTPLLYWFGFFSEICVPLYSICAGYAYMLAYQSGKQDVKSRGKRISKLLKNYWIILALYSLIGLILRSDRIPGSIWHFVGNATLITQNSYNGTWWYLTTYILIQLIPVALITLLPRKLSLGRGVILCLGLEVVRYFISRFSLLPDELHIIFPLDYLYTQLMNMFYVLPYFWVGCFFCRHDVIGWIHTKIPGRMKANGCLKTISLSGIAILFVLTNVSHKAVLMPFVSVSVFLLFNLWPKGRVTKMVFSFLGEHSTNIWLTHMIFLYLARESEYSILVLLVLLVLCITGSYIIKLISHLGDCLLRKINTLFASN